MEKRIALKLYETMIKIRRFEEKVKELYARGEIPGLAHLYIGEEAVAAGVCVNLEAQDYITSTHRGHGHCLAKGGDPKKMMAELYGRLDGYCKGKGGSMHIASIEVGILGAMGIVGSGLPIAVGAAMTAKYKKEDWVSVCFFGDGASNQGTFHESLNLASVHKLPILFVVENNQYQISVPQKQHQAIKDISVRAKAYNMKGKTIDGNDVVEVYKTAKRIVSDLRKGKGPFLLECKTYRWRGHHEGDPNQGDRYRSKDEIESWKKRCPIVRFERFLSNEKKIHHKELQDIEERVENEIEEAIEFARRSPFPPIEEALKDVFIEL